MNLYRENLERAIALLSGLVDEEWCSDVFRAAARAELDSLEKARADLDALQEWNEAPSASMSEEPRREEFGSGNGWRTSEN